MQFALEDINKAVNGAEHELHEWNPFRSMQGQHDSKK